MLCTNGDLPDRAPWQAIFVNPDGQEVGYVYSELLAEVARLETAGLPVPDAFREALREMETSNRPRA